MKNTWLDIELSDYENHMALPNVAQAQYLSNFLYEMLETYKPKSAALLGCAGGNGLEAINKQKLEKIICVDINPNFVEEAENRYKNENKNIEFVCSDITSANFSINNVDLVFVGLVLEYVDLEKATNNIAKHINSNGILAVVLQQPNENIPEVSPSKYKSLEKLSDIFRFVSEEELIEYCNFNGLKLLKQNSKRLESGKSFTELEFRKYQ